MKRVYMDRFIDSIEWMAAGFVGIVAANIFVSVLLRYFFAYSIPDAYDFGRLLLGILIFWGIAATSYRGTHITVDLVWAQCRPALSAHDRRVRDAGAAVRRDGADLHLLFDKVIEHARRQCRAPSICACRSGRSSRSPGSATSSAVLLIALRTYRLIFQPELMARRRKRASRSSERAQ